MSNNREKDKNKNNESTSGPSILGTVFATLAAGAAIGAAAYLGYEVTLILSKIIYFN